MPLSAADISAQAARLASCLTADQLQTRLDAWLEADLAIASNQSYTIADRTFTKADASVISDRIAIHIEALAMVNSGNVGSTRVQGIEPRFSRGRSWPM